MRLRTNFGFGFPHPSEAPSHDLIDRVCTLHKMCIIPIRIISRYMMRRSSIGYGYLWKTKDWIWQAENVQSFLECTVILSCRIQANLVSKLSLSSVASIKHL